jgi:hypothetical protein
VAFDKADGGSYQEGSCWHVSASWCFVCRPSVGWAKNVEMQWLEGNRRREQLNRSIFPTYLLAREFGVYVSALALQPYLDEETGLRQ